MDREQTFSFGIGIPCHNEANNIGSLLNRLCHAWTAPYFPKRIVVVDHGSNDGTSDIVRAYAAQSIIPIKLQSDMERKGKCAAVNQIMRAFEDVEIIILISADILPSESCLMKLLKVFEDETVGVAGGRPIPEGPADNIAVKLSRLLWELHHCVALNNPKSTEVTVFRNLGFQIDETSLVDEAELEYHVTQHGYRVEYVPEAIIRNMSPLSLKDYIRQRTRVTLGHLMLKKKQYVMGTLSMRNRLDAVWELWKQRRFPLFIGMLAFTLEAYIYLLAFCQQAYKPQTSGIWDMIPSAKRSFTQQS